MLRIPSLLLLVLAIAVESPAKEPPSAKTASQLWSITDAVLEHHVEPPTRQEMLLGAVRKLYQLGKTRPPIDLSKQLSAITTEKQLAELLAEAWPTEAKDGAVRAALFDGLIAPVTGDPRFVSKKDLLVEQSIQRNRYVGIGVQIRFNADEKLVQIQVPLREGTALKAGMKTNDLILKVDETDVAGLSLQKVVELLRGKEGTSVSVLVKQPGEKESRTLKMERQPIEFENVIGHRRTAKGWAFRIDPEVPVGYLAIRRTTSSVLSELRKMEPKLRADGCKALILDLRFNPGGRLTDAVQIADGLLDGGTLWKIENKQGTVNAPKADRDCLFRDWPIVVLLDGTTASAAALIVAALKDNKRAVLVGEPSRGAVQVKSLIDLPGELGKAVLWTSKALRANGTEPAWPIRPDHVVTLSANQRRTVVEWQARQDLPTPPGDDVRAPEDPALSRAVDVLKKALAE